MDDLAAFISARLSEDEAAAAAASDGPWDAWRGRPGLGLGQLEHGVTLPGQEAGSLASIATASWMDAEHIARHDPARVLREVAAKRAMVQYCTDELAGDPEEEHASQYNEGFSAAGRAMATWVLRDLAATWSDHPDYRAEWAPGHG
jgi:hypothetical protein